MVLIPIAETKVSEDTSPPETESDMLIFDVSIPLIIDLSVPERIPTLLLSSPPLTYNSPPKSVVPLISRS